MGTIVSGGRLQREKLGCAMGSMKARRNSAAMRGCRVSSKGLNFLLMLVLRREGSLGPLGRESERGDLDRHTSGSMGGANPPSHGRWAILYQPPSSHSFSAKKKGGSSLQMGGKEMRGGGGACRAVPCRAVWWTGNACVWGGGDPVVGGWTGHVYVSLDASHRPILVHQSPFSFSHPSPSLPSPLPLLTPLELTRLLYISLLCPDADSLYRMV